MVRHRGNVGLDRQLATFGHRISRINGEIQQYLLELVWISLNLVQVGAKSQQKIDVFAD